VQQKKCQSLALKKERKNSTIYLDNKQWAGDVFSLHPLLLLLLLLLLMLLKLPVLLYLKLLLVLLLLLLEEVQLVRVEGRGRLAKLGELLRQGLDRMVFLR